MSFTSTGIRKRNLDTDRLQAILNADEQGFIQRMKPFNAEAAARGLVDTGQSGGQQANDSEDIFTTAGKAINGAIGYVQNVIDITANDTIDFLRDNVLDPFASYFKLDSVGVGKIIDVFNGGDFPGQILKLQGDDTDTVTINNANSPGNTTSNIILPGTGASMTLGTEQLTEFVFDPLKSINGFVGAWRLASEATAGGGTLPSGTAVNDHLEWNGVSWDASQFLEFNATGPFADSGFLRFPNDNIMLSGRNQLDDGNLELKIDSSDNFDFTESNNAPVILQLRAQDAVAADQLGTIQQDGNTTGEMVLRTPDGFSINIGGAPTATFAALAATGIEFFDFLDMSGNQIQDLTALVYTGFTGDGKSISRFATGVNYDIENSTHEHLFRVNGNPPADVFSIKDGFVELSGTNTATSGKIRFSNDAIMLSARNATPDGNVELKIDTSNNFDFTHTKEGPVTIQLRAQHDTVADKTGQISQQANVNGRMSILTATAFDFIIGGDTQMSIAPLAATGIEFFDFLDMSGNQVQDVTALVYTGFGTDGKSISRFTTGSGGINYDLENSLAVHQFRVNGNPPSDRLAISNLAVTVEGSATSLSIPEFFIMNATTATGVADGVMWHDSGTGNVLVRSGGSEKNLSDIGLGGEFFGPWTADHDAGGFDLTDISNLEFRVTTLKPAASISAVYNEAGGMRYNSGVSENHEWSINDAIELQLSGSGLDLVGSNLLNAQIMQSNATTPADNGTIRLGNAQSIQWRQTGAFNATMAFDAFDDFVFNYNALTGDANFLIKSIDNTIVRLRSDNNVVGEAAGFFLFEGREATPSTQEYARIVAIIRDITAGSEGGSLSLNVADVTLSGASTTYLSLRGDNGEIDMFRALAMNTKPVIEIDFLALTEKAGDPPVIANEGVLYTKDVSGDTRLFYDNNTEAPVQLGSGSQTPWLTDIDADGNSLQDLDTIEFRDNVTPPGISTGAIYYENTTTGMNFNAITGDDFTWRVNGAIQMRLDVIHLDLGSMGGGGEIECNLYESSSDGLVEISMGTTGISYSVNSGDIHTFTVISGNDMTYNGNQLDLNTSKIVGVGDIDPDSNNLYDFGSNALRWRIIYLQEFTNTEEGFAAGFAPVGSTDDAMVFCRPSAGGKTELRVKFQTGSSIQIEVEP